MSERRDRIDRIDHEGEVVEVEGRPRDPELNVRAIAWSAVGLAVMTAGCCVVSWWLFLGLRSHNAADDRPISPLREAQERVLPPEPRLQSDPAADMETLRAAEKQALERPEWIDRNQGTLRIPIDLAMEVIARRGVGAGTGTVEPTPAPSAGSTVAGASGSPAPTPGSTP
jgi:hypothetical protein